MSDLEWIERNEMVEHTHSMWVNSAGDWYEADRPKVGSMDVEKARYYRSVEYETVFLTPEVEEDPGCISAIYEAGEMPKANYRRVIMEWVEEVPQANLY